MQGGMRDAGERFSSKKSLMTGNQHVGKSQQTLEHIILYDLIGQILKEQVTFLFVHIQAEGADFSGFQPCNDCGVYRTRRGSY